MQFQEELAWFIYIVVIYILLELQIKTLVPLFNLKIHLNLSWIGTHWIYRSRKISKNHTLPFIQIYPAGSLRGNFEEYQSRGCVYLEHIMRDEAKRRRSFYCIVIDNCPILLASAGFYGTGNGDETRCYSCGMRRRGWQRWEIPGRIDHKPQCKHRYGRDERNIPIVEIPSPHQVEMYHRQLNIIRRSLASIRSSPVIHRRVPVRRPRFSSLIAYLAQVRERIVSQLEEMCYEVRRFQSYNSVRIRASPMRLAQSGFYATGSGDETRCYSCRMTYRDWRLMDHPDQIHRSMSPDCPHLNNTDQSNIPVSSSASDSDVTTVRGVIGEYPITNGSSENVTYQPEAASTSVSETSATSSTSTETPALTGLDISKAVYPQYRDVSSRLDSYQGWGWSHVQDPQVLARAGFYYAGYRDCVRCFYCGVGLRTWEREDDPWVEHVRWRSSCDYVRLMRREHFVIQALTKQDPSVPSASPVPPMDNQPQNSQQAMAGNGTDAIAKAEEMGFQRDLIERAVTEMTRSGNASEITSNRDTIQLETLLERLVLMDEQPMTTSPSLQNSAPSHPNTSRQPPAVNDQPTSVPATTTEMGSIGHIQIGSSATLTSRIRQSHAGTSADVTSSERSTPGSSSNAAGAPSSLTSQKLVETGHTTGENKGGKKSKKKKKKGEDDGSKNKTNSASYELGALSANQERQLEEENQSLRDEGTCKICLDNPSCIVFLPCGHLVTCAECAPALRKCPICRALIRGTVRAHTVSSDSLNI